MGSGYFTRLAAALVAALLLGAVVIKPDAGRRAVEKAASLQPPAAARALRACAPGDAPLSGPFAPIEDVLSISPLGAVTAPGESLPTPYIRINTKKGSNAFERRQTRALAPARGDVVALERRILRDDAGRATGQIWTVRMRPCDRVEVYYDGLDQIAPDILRRAGGLESFVEIGGPDHLARQTAIRVQAGEVLGEAAGFDVGLIDFGVSPAATARPERYAVNPYDMAAVTRAPPALLSAISADHTRARCPLNYLPAELGAAWTHKLGDAWGMRRARGDDPCRAALVDTPGAAQGAWFTDASHNAAANRVSAIALAPDSVDPSRLIFALHGRLKTLTPDMIALPNPKAEARQEAARDFLSFEQGGGRINPPFHAVREGEVYCYERLRANFVGPLIDGVILLRLERAENGAELMKLEARRNASACLDLEEPWSFTGAETTFYR